MNATMTDPTTIRTYRIPASLDQAARDKVAKVNRRLTRLGLPLYRVEIQPGPDEIVYDDRGARTVIDGVPHYFEQGRTVPCPILGYRATIDVTIIGEVPRLADWEPVAVLTREQDGPVITRLWPGLATEPNLTTFRGTDPQCEHCHTRRHRNDTYVVRNTATGELRQIGRNCLTAFTGIHVSIPRWVSDGDDGFDEMGGWGGSAADLRWPVLDVLRITCAVVAEFGWVSRTTAQDYGTATATADLVLNVLSSPSESARALRERIAPLEPAAAVKAVLVRDHAVRMADERGEYATNLSTVAAQEWVGPRNLPLLASALAAFARQEEREVRAATTAESTWVGEAKGKGTWTLTVAAVHVLDSFHTSTLVTMVDADGNSFKWFASGVRDFNPGDVLTLKGTIKAHDEYRGVKQTQLTRCTVLASTPAS